MSGTIVFDILDFWHASAGHGAGRFLDASVQRTPAGLPVLPGRTVKGLMRDAADQCSEFGHLPEDLATRLFGSRLGTSRFETEPGLLQFGNAELPDGWEDYAQTEEGQKILSGFFDHIASTAIGEDGQAEEGSLRRIEVAIPLQLHAPWRSTDPTATDEARRALQKACGLVRRLGVSRTRGLGRARVYLKDKRS